MSKSKAIYCYETKERFETSMEAARSIGKNSSSNITKVLNNPHKTAGSYHWCTDLSIFDEIKDELTAGSTIKKVIYCYETKEKFDSINQAAKHYNFNKSLLDDTVLNNPNRTVGSYHWCTDLAIFDVIKDELTIGSTIKKVIYCYETKERFESINDAQKKYNVTGINIVLDNPNRTIVGYHWCTDLEEFEKLNPSTYYIETVYCYETKMKFNSTTEAANYIGYDRSSINGCLNKPNRTLGGYHWCTDLAIFDSVKLSGGITPIQKEIFCYETKEKFDSINKAAKKYNVSVSDIIKVLDNPNRTIVSYHWCTDLAIFDEIKDELTSGKDLYKIVVYNYETKERFDSIMDAQAKYNIGGIGLILNNPNKSAAGYHWCTDLTIFDNVILSSGSDLSKIIVYCYETKEKFDSINQAQIKYNIKTNISAVLDNPNRTAGNYHWCTDLSIFDKIEVYQGRELYKISVYCYETKEKFESLTEVANKFGIINGSSISHVLNNPKRTAYGYHWCTSLDKFKPEDLVYPDSGISGLEKEITDFIKSIYDGEVIENSRNIISPYELDIYLPKLNLAFEFNGDYWHSESQGKDRNYHINKTNLCKSKNIQLIHIFEYQYIKNPIIIKSMIMNKLNKNKIRLYARNCEVKLINDNNEVRNFLEENHIQGYVTSNINIGLYCNNVLVSIMTFGKSRFDKSIEYELLRYSSLRSTNVIGGASKLLKYFEKIYKPKSLISYADISYSNGNLYTKLGFNFIGTSDPDYVNIKNNIVYPRYQTMKHKLPKLLGEENFDINLTEQQNLDNNGFLRIWKCGNLKFLKEYNYNE